MTDKKIKLITKICLAPNNPSINHICTKQCMECKEFQEDLNNPKIESPEKIAEMKANYDEIIKKSKLK